MVRSLTTVLWLFTVFVVAFSAVPWQNTLASGAPEIDLLSEAQVEGSEIFLADVASLSGSADWLERLESIVVGTSPLVGSTRRLTAPQVEVRLRRAGIHPSEVNLTGALQVQVQRVHPVLTSEGTEARNSSGAGTAVDPLLEEDQGSMPDAEPVEPAPGMVFQDIVTAVRDISQGEILHAEDLRVETVEVRSTYRDAGALVDFVDKQTTRSIRAGARLSLNGVQVPPVITRGDRIWIRAIAGGIIVQAPGTARETGGLGDMILVINDVSGQRLQAVIVDTETVEVPLKGAGIE